MPAILESLPDLYRRLLPAFFECEVPVESKATCGDCAMCASASGTGGAAVEPVDGVDRFFRPDTKCCTYHPRLPNYLVGAILADEDPGMAEGRRRVRERVLSGIGVRPLWLRAPDMYTLLYNNARRAFGRSESLLCPWYQREGGLCTIWRHRESVCSTFFCKYVAGADGRNFWQALKSYLATIELVLSRYAVWKLLPEHVLDGGYRNDREAGTLTAADLDGAGPTHKDRAALWRGWAGREEEFYRACFDVVRALDRDEVTRLLGLDGELDLALLQELHGIAVAPKLPETLRFNPAATVKWLPDGSVALGAYSEYEGLALPGVAYSLVIEFNGRESVAAVRRRLREEKQVDLDDELLLALHRHRVLVEA